MKKQYNTYIHLQGKFLEHICVSGGKKGIQIKLSPVDLLNLVNGKYEDLIN